METVLSIRYRADSMLQTRPAYKGTPGNAPQAKAFVELYVLCGLRF